MRSFELFSHQLVTRNFWQFKGISVKCASVLSFLSLFNVRNCFLSMAVKVPPAFQVSLRHHYSKRKPHGHGYHHLSLPLKKNKMPYHQIKLLINYIQELMHVFLNTCMGYHYCFMHQINIFIYIYSYFFVYLVNINQGLIK